MNELSLHDLQEKHWLTSRTFNICKDNDLLSLSNIISYYSEHRSFLKIRNCESPSNKELIALLDNYIYRDLLINQKLTHLPEINSTNNMALSELRKDGRFV